MGLTAPEVEMSGQKQPSPPVKEMTIIFFLGELSQAERLLLAHMPCPRPVPPLPAQGQSDRRQCSAHVQLAGMSG